MQVNELLQTFNNPMKLAQQKNQSNTEASNRLVYVQLLNCHYMLRQVEGDVLKPASPTMFDATAQHNKALRLKLRLFGNPVFEIYIDKRVVWKEKFEVEQS